MEFILFNCCCVLVLNKGQSLSDYWRLLNRNGGYIWTQMRSTLTCSTKNPDDQHIVVVVYVLRFLIALFIFSSINFRFICFVLKLMMKQLSTPFTFSFTMNLNYCATVIDWILANEHSSFLNKVIKLSMILSLFKSFEIKIKFHS